MDKEFKDIVEGWLWCVASIIIILIGLAGTYKLLEFGGFIKSATASNFGILAGFVPSVLIVSGIIFTATYFKEKWATNNPDTVVAVQPSPLVTAVPLIEPAVPVEEPMMSIPDNGKNIIGEGKPKTDAEVASSLVFDEDIPIEEEYLFDSEDFGVEIDSEDCYAEYDDDICDYYADYSEGYA